MRETTIVVVGNHKLAEKVESIATPQMYFTHSKGNGFQPRRTTG
jgi:hypothetical protein